MQAAGLAVVSGRDVHRAARAAALAALAAARAERRAERADALELLDLRPDLLAAARLLEREREVDRAAVERRDDRVAPARVARARGRGRAAAAARGRAVQALGAPLLPQDDVLALRAAEERSRATRRSA